MSAALMLTPAEVREAYAAALGRVRGRENVYRSVTEAERRRAWVENREPDTGPGVYSPRFREPGTLAEWLDDTVVTWAKTGLAEAPLVVTLAEAAREGIPAAVRALGAARDLAPAVAWNVYLNLEGWRAADERGRTLGAQLAAALLQEWERLRLPTEDPAMAAPPKRRRRSWEATETAGAA